MAVKVQAQVAGGEIKQIEASTVKEVMTQLGAEGYVASVNGDPVDADYELSEYEFVSLSKPVKAG